MGYAFRCTTSLSSALLLAGMVMGCEPVPAENARIDVGSTTAVLSEGTPPGQTVCDPFADPTGDGSASERGILGEIRALPAGVLPPTSVLQYLEVGEPLDASLFLNQVSVPTRAFDLGFATQSGQLLTTSTGDTLYENFSMHLDTEIRLAPGDEPGLYQFALLADDGAILMLDDGDGLRTVVDNDGLHATRMKCAGTPIRMEAGSTYPAKIHYYQGPRHHIALTLLWRPWGSEDESTVPSEKECDKIGNAYFWDSTFIPSKPKAFTGLLDRGWRVVAPKNFMLPRSVRQNPCTVADPVRTFITEASPGALTASGTARFVFNSNKAGSSFECALDGALPAICTSPMSYTGLTSGEHHFQVWAVDTKGVRDEVGAESSWEIDQVSPSAFSVTTSSTTTTVTVNWKSSEPTTSFLYWGTAQSLGSQIQLDGEYRLDHSVTLTGLNAGSIYYFQIAGRDRAGNLTSPQITSAARTRR